MSGYTTVKIPDEVATIADKLRKKKELGYRSRASVVIDGIRRLGIEFGIIRNAGPKDRKKVGRGKRGKGNRLDDFDEGG